MKILSLEDEQILGEVAPESITPQVRINILNPTHLGHLPNADGTSHLTGMCEDTVSVQVRVKDKRIVDARFEVKGCGFTIACGNVACAQITGNTLAAALSLNGASIDQALGGLPGEHRHCADLAANAAKAAVEDALQNARDPWKNMYGTRR